MTSFNGLGVGLSNLYRLSSAKTRSISPENFSGEKGKGGMATEGTGASVAYWYQTLPTAPFPTLPDRDYLEIV